MTALLTIRKIYQDSRDRTYALQNSLNFTAQAAMYDNDFFYRARAAILPIIHNLVELEALSNFRIDMVKQDVWYMSMFGYGGRFGEISLCRETVVDSCILGYLKVNLFEPGGDKSSILIPLRSVVLPLPDHEVQYVLRSIVDRVNGTVPRHAYLDHVAP